jgi:hypothetical protein
MRRYLVACCRCRTNLPLCSCATLSTEKKKNSQRKTDNRNDQQQNFETPSAALAVQIGGTDPDQFSVLNVLGNANLNGELDPELMNGFVPSIGQSFTILDYGSVTGSFSHIRNQVFDNGRKRWSLVYQPTGAALVVVRNGSSTPR